MTISCEGAFRLSIPRGTGQALTMVGAQLAHQAGGSWSGDAHSGKFTLPNMRGVYRFTDSAIFFSVANDSDALSCADMVRTLGQSIWNLPEAIVTATISEMGVPDVPVARKPSTATDISDRVVSGPAPSPDSYSNGSAPTTGNAQSSSAVSRLVIGIGVGVLIISVGYALWKR